MVSYADNFEPLLAFCMSTDLNRVGYFGLFGSTIVLVQNFYFLRHRAT